MTDRGHDAPTTPESLVPDALAASSVGSWDYDVARDILRCDRAMATLYGFSAEEASRGMPLERLTATLHPEDRVTLYAKLAVNRRNGGVFVQEYRILPSPTQMRWILVRGRYDDPDSDGRMVRARGIAVDITESKRDGYAEGDIILMSEADSGTATALDRAARHLLAARQALHDFGASGLSRLRPAVDEAILQVGLAIAGSLTPVTPNRTEH